MFSITRTGVFLLTALAILTAWYAASAVLFVVSEEAPAALVLFPDGRLSPNNLPSGVLITRWNRYFAVLVGEHSGYVRALYEAGAPLVLPARAGGCLNLRPPTAKRS